MGLVVVLIIGVIVCIFPIAIITLIVSAIVKKNKEAKGNNKSFERTIRQIYIYIILIITFISILFGIIVTFRVGLDVILPEESIYETSYSDEQREKNANIVELFTTLSLVIAVIPVYIYHNKLAQESRKVDVDESENKERN